MCILENLTAEQLNNEIKRCEMIQRQTTGKGIKEAYSQYANRLKRIHTGLLLTAIPGPTVSPIN
jgi:hypothetical protein